ncbi:MAG: DNA primase [Elusimicrobiota bacterium]
MPIPEATIQNILSSCNIVEIVEEYVRLVKSGRNFKARCPFHNEKTPSFYVSPERQIFHCFGCNTGGNAVGFVMKIEGLTYPEALRKLAQRYKIVIKEEYWAFDDRLSKEKEQIYKILEEVAQFYQRYLNERAPANIKDWLKKRGLSNKTIEKFRIGYAPQKPQILFNAAVKKGYSPEILSKAGIVSNDKDFFYNRIIFPIFDITGRVIAFGGRVLDDDSAVESVQPKYLNSPETIVYSKSRILYGLNFAGKPIREKDSVVILEGYIDVIVCHQFGISNTVATLGTSFTAQHSALLKRYTDNIMIAFDPDTAGRASALRSCEVLLADDLNVQVAQLPEGKDSDEILLADGAEKLKSIFNNSKSYVDFIINEKSAVIDIKTAEGKKNIAKSVLPVISKIPNAIVKSEYIKKLAEWLNVKEEFLTVELAKIKPGRYETKPDSSSAIKEINITEKQLMLLLVRDIKLVDLFPVDFQYDFSNEEIKKIFDLLLTLRKKGQTSTTPAEIVELAGGSELIAGILMDDCNIAEAEKFVKSFLHAVQLNTDKKNLQALKKNDIKTYMEISKKIKGSKK